MKSDGEHTTLTKIPSYEFDDVASKLPTYLKRLEACPLMEMDTRQERNALGKKLHTDAGISTYDREGKPTQPGIYVLYEDDTPMYAGRSDHLKDRLLNHGRPSSGSESASFAFILAKEDFEKTELKAAALKGQPRSRKELQNAPEFEPLFDAAKERVKKMSIRAVGIQDPIEQTIFEVYAHLQLRTPYNDFNTH